MKLVIQIPCLNERDQLAATLADLPRELPGIDAIEVLVIDDGSSDGTAELARRLGVEQVVRFRAHRGLAAAFMAGIDAALRRGADIIVNTDADNQYCGADIARLVEPIVAGRADVVIGDRQTGTIEHFSRGKRLLQALGSAVVRRASGIDVPDAVSGFRAFSREAALKLTGVAAFSYTIESLLQLGSRGLAVTSVPVRTNRTTRPSRLFRSVPEFLMKSAAILVRSYLMHRPLRVFSMLGAAVLALGLAPIVRFLYFYFADGGRGHIQSLVLGSALLSIGFMILVLGLLADLIACNRRLIELTLEKVRRLEVHEASRKRSRAERTRPRRAKEQQHDPAEVAATDIRALDGPAMRERTRA